MKIKCDTECEVEPEDLCSEDEVELVGQLLLPPDEEEQPHLEDGG